MPKAIYLDNAATTALDPAVLEAMLPTLQGPAGNPSSRHAAGRVVRRALDQARRQLAESLGAEPAEILFTSGATEANNLAIHSALRAPHPRLFVAATEHPSVLEPVRATANTRSVIELAVTAEGILEPGTLANVLASPVDQKAALLAVQLANSETGVIQRVAELVRVIHKQYPDCWIHCDAVQAVGKLPIHFHELGVSSLALSGHKIHGPGGVGALVIRQGWRARPLWAGGGQQQGLRPGTEPVAAIVGLGAAVARAEAQRDDAARRMARLRDDFEAALRTQIPGLQVNGAVDQRLPSASNLSFPHCTAESLLLALDLEGVCCSAGTACASGSLEPSPVLQAMGFAGDRLHGALRFSLCRLTTEAEMADAVTRIVRAYQAARTKPATCGDG